MNKTNTKDTSKDKPIEMDMEGNVTITKVELEALVLLKLLKHTKEVYPAQASGLLLGLDFNERLEVTNTFSFPNIEDTPAVNVAQYRVDMIRHLREVNVDSTTVGWYVSCQLNDFLTQSFIDTQASYQKSLGKKCVALVHDVARSSIGALHLKAYRLSDGFMKAYQEKNFTSENLKQNGLTASNILVEVPIVLHNTHLINTLLYDLESTPTPSNFPTYSFQNKENSTPSSLDANFNGLELTIEPYIERNLEQLLEGLDDFQQETNAFHYHARTVAREKQKVLSMIQAKKAENESRIARGLEPLPIETEAQLLSSTKLPAEPSHLDALLIHHQLDAYCTQLNSFSGPTLTKMYATQALQTKSKAKSN